MKNIRFVIFFLSLLISTVCFSQTDCGNNSGFETGTTTGWVCKSGWYGTGPCPTPQDIPMLNEKVINLSCG